MGEFIQHFVTNPYSIVAFGATVLVFGMGGFVITRNPSASINKYFASYAFAITLWAFSETMLTAVRTSQTALMWTRIGALGGMFLGPIFLLFVLAFTQRTKLLNNFYFLLVLFGITLALFSWSLYVSPSSPEDFIHSPSGWDAPLTLPFKIVLLWEPLLFLWGFYFCWIFYGETRDTLLKKQALIIIIASAIPLIFGIIETAILPALEIYEGPIAAVSPILFSFTSVVLTAPLAYAVIKYKLFASITPQTAAAVIVDTMKDALVVTDERFEIQFVNAFTSELLGREKGDLVGKSLSALFTSEEWKTLERNKISLLRKDEEITDFETQLKKEMGDEIPVAVAASKLVAGTTKPMGFIFVARDIRESKKLIGELEKTTEELKQAKYNLERKIGRIIET